MLRINLLPTKAAKKHEGMRQEILVIVALLLVVVVGLYIWSHLIGSDLSAMDTRIATVSQEIAQLRQDVVRVEDFKKKAEVLEKKIGVITRLQSQRTGPAHLLDDLAVILTEQHKVWLTRLVEGGGALVLEGGAMEHENISDFQLALEKRSKFITAPALGTVKSNDSHGGGVVYIEWKMTCKTNYSGS
ncbi:MAG: PilN domain-containing protein [Deltaproteobacteria bacterium]|nr:PilN domain-containing protein [Deltaproteobacteria bacterium]